MNNPKINLVSLRQSLSGQFASLTFRNGERDDFRAPFQELSGAQKRSYITLGTDLAAMELVIRLDNKSKPRQLILDFIKFSVLRPDLIIRSEFIDTCSECDDKCTHVFIDFVKAPTTEDERPITFSWQVYCETHLPTPDA